MTREPGYHWGDGSGTEAPSPAEYMDEPVLRLEHLEVERVLGQLKLARRGERAGVEEETP